MDRRALVREYKETPRPMGVFRVRNVHEGRSYVGTSVNLPGMLNRMRFQLEMGSHPSKELQRDWNALGDDGFVIEVLDQIDPSDEPDYDPTSDLENLLELWLDRLADEGETLY